jgi:hypothetical protein
LNRSSLKKYHHFLSKAALVFYSRNIDRNTYNNAKVLSKKD